MILSIVLPAYNEGDNLRDCHRRLMAAVSEYAPDLELIFVDDGSTDHTASILNELHRSDPRVKAVLLSRNFGHQIAVAAGLAHAGGDAVIVMDSDLQDPPEVLPRLIEEWKKGYEVVYGVRRKRKEGWLLRLAFWGFYRIWRSLSEIPVPVDAGDFCLMDRKVVNAILACPERNRFVRAIRSWVGFKQTGVQYEREARQRGESGYRFFPRLSGALDGIFSMSDVPLQIASYTGILFALAGFLSIFYLLFRKIVLRISPEGWTSLLAVVLILGGVQLIVLGIMGGYLGRVYREVRSRPLYVVRETWGLGPASDKPHTIPPA